MHQIVSVFWRYLSIASKFLFEQLVMEIQKVTFGATCVKILIFLMYSNIASTDLHVAKSTYTHNLKVESQIILLHFRYQTKSSRMQYIAVKCILTSYPQKIDLCTRMTLVIFCVRVRTQIQVLFKEEVTSISKRCVTFSCDEN